MTEKDVAVALQGHVNPNVADVKYNTALIYQLVVMDTVPEHDISASQADQHLRRTNRHLVLPCAPWTVTWESGGVDGRERTDASTRDFVESASNKALWRSGCQHFVKETLRQKARGAQE